MEHVEQTPRASSPVTRTNLDLMRALAVCLVVLDHTTIHLHHQVVRGWNLGWLGVFGVYLFFVHTSLVLMWSLERRPHTLDFYVRRIFRIYPLAMIVIAVIAAFHLEDFPEPVTVRNLLSNLLLVTNLTHARLVSGVLWSLPLELQMYLFLPLLFLFARRERRLWPFLLIWAYVSRVVWLMFPSGMSYQLAFGTIPLFLPGVLAYIGYKRRKARVPAAVFPLLLVALGAFYTAKPSVPRGWVACLVVGLALPSFAEISNRVVVDATHAIAKYSYGIYLLHPLVLLVVFERLRLRYAWERVGLEGVSIAVLSMLAYHLVEHPLVNLGSRVANRLQQRFGTSYAEDYGLDLA